MPKKVLLHSKPRYLFQTIISRVFDPPVVIILLTAYAVLRSALSFHGLVVFAFILPFLLGLPLGFFLWKLKTHQVSNWDVSVRRERIIPLAFLLVFLLIDIILISWFDNPFLLNYFVLYFLWVLGFFLITLFWKISGHTGIITLAVGLMLLWFGVAAWPFILIIPIVCWARVSRHDHTLFQAIAGVVYSVVILRMWILILPQ